jgi:hypothetical protein
MVSIQISPEAEKAYNKAMDIWDETKTLKELSAQEKSDITAFLSLAVKRANGAYPLAQGKLALFYPGFVSSSMGPPQHNFIGNQSAIIIVFMHQGTLCYG